MHRQSIPHATRHRGALLPAVPARRPRSRPPPRLSPRRRAGGGEQLPPGIQGLVSDLRSDPALAPLLDDPKLAAAIQEVARDPCALQRYANDPKVRRQDARFLIHMPWLWVWSSSRRRAAQCREAAPAWPASKASGSRLRQSLQHPRNSPRRCAPRPQVMAILGRLLERDLPPTQAAAFSAMVRAATPVRPPPPPRRGRAPRVESWACTKPPAALAPRPHRTPHRPAPSPQGTTPRGALSSMTSDAELAQLLGTPKVRAVTRRGRRRACAIAPDAPQRRRSALARCAVHA